MNGRPDLDVGHIERHECVQVSSIDGEGEPERQLLNRLVRKDPVELLLYGRVAHLLPHSLASCPRPTTVGRCLCGSVFTQDSRTPRSVSCAMSGPGSNNSAS